MSTLLRPGLLPTLLALAFLGAGGPAHAAQVMCWGGGIPCFPVTNCNGHPACDGNNQPCCLGSPSAFAGVSTFSDQLGASSGLAVTHTVSVTGELPGTVIVDLFSGGKLVGERLVPLPAANTPVNIDLGVRGATVDFFRIYVELAVEKESAPPEPERAAVSAPTVHHISRVRLSATPAERQAVVAAFGGLERSVRLSPDTLLDSEGTATQCP